MIFWDNVKSLFNTGSQCVFCGKELPLDERICEMCSEEERKLRKSNINENGVAYVYDYDGIIRSLLHSLKYNDDLRGAYYAAEIMVREFKRYNIDLSNAVVSNVPVHKSRKKSRGFDQCEVIAKRFADIAELPYIELFQRVKKTKAQFQLSAAEREENMRGAFELARNKIEPGGRKVILIDDICTTGSTLKECAKLLPETTTVFPYVFANE